MKWSDIDYWEKEIGINLWNIRYQIKHLIKLHPHTMRFLDFLKKYKKKVYIVTASHPKDIRFKMNHTKIGKYFDGIYSQYEIGTLKHDKLFWKKLKEKIHYKNDRTLFADDNKDIIKVAKSCGIKFLVLKSKSSSKKSEKIPKGLFYVRHFDELIPTS